MFEFEDFGEVIKFAILFGCFTLVCPLVHLAMDGEWIPIQILRTPEGMLSVAVAWFLALTGRPLINPFAHRNRVP